MSMGIILQVVRDHLQTEMSLDAGECGIQPGGLPPDGAGELYVAVDELGIRSASRNQLHEIYEIEVAIWRRSSNYPTDRQGDVVLRDDPQLAGILTLDDLERDVISKLHANHTDIMAVANSAIGAGSPGGGDVFQQPLYFAGRGRSESLRPGGSKSPVAWIGRRLKFTGMTRVQATDVMA